MNNIIQNILYKLFSEIVKRIETSKASIEFLPTGFSDMDTFLDGGFMRKELIVLGGPTGKGKSFIAGGVFFNIAKKGFKSAYFSLEISNEMIASRLIGSLANIKPTRLISGLLTPQEVKDRNTAQATIGAFDKFMHFYDSVYELSKIEKEIRDNKYEFVVIDFAQNIITGKLDEYERLSFIALQLQRIAKETNSCILLLSQLSNAVTREKSTDVVEYKGSGTLATVCDLGLFIERDEISSNINTFSIRIRKNRRGISGVAFSFEFKQPGGKIIDYKQSNMMGGKPINQE